jgi:hypothetical protein
MLGWPTKEHNICKGIIASGGELGIICNATVNDAELKIGNHKLVSYNKVHAICKPGMDTWQACVQFDKQGKMELYITIAYLYVILGSITLISRSGKVDETAMYVGSESILPLTSADVFIDKDSIYPDISIGSDSKAICS